MKRSLREKVWDKCGKRCAYCGVELEYKNMQVDHLIPQNSYKKSEWINGVLEKWEDLVIKNNVLAPENLMPSCRSCNYYKSSMSLDKFREELGKVVNRLRRDISNFRLAIKYKMIEIKKWDMVFYFERVKNVK